MEAEITQQIVEHNDIFRMMFGTYFIQILVLFALLYVIFSGKLKDIWKKLTKIKKVKAGPFEIETSEDDAPTLSADCPHGDCKSYSDKNFNKIWARVDSLADTDVQILETMKKMNKKLDCLTEELTKAFEIVDDLTISQLKLVFYNKEMPDAERLAAGLKYISKGMNHQMKQDVIVFGRKHIDMYSAIVAMSPMLKVTAIETGCDDDDDDCIEQRLEIAR